MEIGRWVDGGFQTLATGAEFPGIFSPNSMHMAYVGVRIEHLLHQRPIAGQEVEGAEYEPGQVSADLWFQGEMFASGSRQVVAPDGRIETFVRVMITGANIDDLDGQAIVARAGTADGCWRQAVDFRSVLLVF